MRSEPPTGPTLGALAVIATLVAASITTGSVTGTAHPPPSTDHGVPARTFHVLWSGDHDAAGDASGSDASGSAVAQLAARTDIPFDTPPAAVARWNRGEHGEFPTTDRSVSVHPPNASRTDRRFVRDAHATVFTVQPATRARLSPGRHPLYVAPNGTLLGTVDYRIVVPDDRHGADRRVHWTLESHRINATRLLLDGAVMTTGNGTRTPALSYALDARGERSRTLTLAADITARLRKRVETCVTRNETGACTEWRTSIERHTETVTVTDSLTVVTYDLVVSGYIARYPNGDLGLVVYKNKPWLGYAVPGGDVRGVWRFYTARDTDWDTLVSSRASGTTTRHSPLHPLRVTAYPIETGPTPTPRRTVSILDVYGTPTAPPSLPARVQLDTIESPYVASYGIATRAPRAGSFTTVRAWGLVRGVNATRPADAFAEVDIHRSRLTLSVVNASDGSVTVRVRLRDRRTGAPIATVEREGYVVLEGRRLNTSRDGTVTARLDRPPGGVSARFVPGRWWRNLPGYTRDSATVLGPGVHVGGPGTFARIGVLVALFLLAGTLIGRITGWRLWPPWRGL